ncbi:uncharacterized protein LOC133290709 isoform X2 [Gastrolobium bilobum]|uniref:uncharacterized protein LOC133290709 isoform X2 n=1 Tax=Gastrolobium bilobum TaxID=150636 RepID=UPI002AB08A20|nr:uncharacterized protein LOC133290709 isoform X2 [Gastrolobium bilobum]
MGISYSTHDFRSSCTSFEEGATGSTESKWGLGFSTNLVFMEKAKKNLDKDVWKLNYDTCTYSTIRNCLEVGVDSVSFSLYDCAYYFKKTNIFVNFTRIGSEYGLRGGITSFKTSGTHKSFIRVERDYLIETTIVYYGVFEIKSLFVLEKKKNVNSENACVVTLAHYYSSIHEFSGIFAVAEIRCNEGSSGFDVEVKGPYQGRTGELRKVREETIRTGIWSHGREKAGTVTKIRDSNSSLKPQSHYQSDDIDKVRQNVKQAFFSSDVKEQSNKGLINSTGYTADCDSTVFGLSACVDSWHWIVSLQGKLSCPRFIHCWFRHTPCGNGLYACCVTCFDI